MKKLQTLLYFFWNFEYRKFKPAHMKLTLVLVLIFGLIYVSGEIFLGQHAVTRAYTFINFKAAFQSIASAINPLSFERIFPLIWITLAVLLAVFRYAVIVTSFFKTRKVFGDSAFTQSFLTYFPATILSLSVSLLIITASNAIAQRFGYTITDGLTVFEQGAKIFTGFIDSHIPSLINVNNYWLAIFLSIMLSGLPNYILHSLSHSSRLFWYVFHRAHHATEILQPLGVTEAYSFGFLLPLPNALIAIVISKLIYLQPLVSEMLIWFMLGYFFEIFNHSVVYYDFAYNNPVVRNMTRLFGDTGVYHIMHHSALEQDQNINFAGSPFNFWDRVFGTYRKPYKTIPPIGLTNQPEIKMNPFRVTFGGIRQLLYEFKNNKDWNVRWKILFGSVYYKPPITKDYLIDEDGGYNVVLHQIAS